MSTGENRQRKIEALKVLDWEELKALPHSTYEGFTLLELKDITGSVVDSYRLTGNEEGLLSYVIDNDELIRELLFEQLDRSFLLNEINELICSRQS